MAKIKIGETIYDVTNVKIARYENGKVLEEQDFADQAHAVGDAFQKLNEVMGESIDRMTRAAFLQGEFSVFMDGVNPNLFHTVSGHSIHEDPDFTTPRYTSWEHLGNMPRYKYETDFTEEARKQGVYVGPHEVKEGDVIQGTARKVEKKEEPPSSPLLPGEGDNE